MEKTKPFPKRRKGEALTDWIEQCVGHLVSQQDYWGAMEAAAVLVRIERREKER